MTPEICICAAVKTTCGKIFRGHRHNNCISIIVANGYEHKGNPDSQGFITSLNRFVTREEGYLIQKRAGIKSVALDGYRGKRLFSEDLY